MFIFDRPFNIQSYSGQPDHFKGVIYLLAPKSKYNYRYCFTNYNTQLWLFHNILHNLSSMKRYLLTELHDIH